MDPRPAKKRKKKKTIQQLSFSIGSFCPGEPHTAAGSVTLWSSSVSIPTSSCRSIEQLRRALPRPRSAGRAPAAALGHGAEPGLRTYEELLLAFGVPLQDGLQQLGRLARQGTVRAAGWPRWAAPLQRSGTVPRRGVTSQCSSGDSAEAALMPGEWFVSQGQAELSRDSRVWAVQRHGLFPGDPLVPASLPQTRTAPSTALPAPQPSPELSSTSGGRALSSNRRCSLRCPATPRPRQSVSVTAGLSPPPLRRCPPAPARWHGHYHSLPPPPLPAVQLLLAADLQTATQSENKPGNAQCQGPSRGPSHSQSVI